jgi:hypothetical protein
MFVPVFQAVVVRKGPTGRVVLRVLLISMQLLLVAKEGLLGSNIVMVLVAAEELQSSTQMFVERVSIWQEMRMVVEEVLKDLRVMSILMLDSIGEVLILVSV